MDEWIDFYNTAYPSMNSITFDKLDKFSYDFKASSNSNTNIQPTNNNMLSIVQKADTSYANVKDIVTYYLKLKNTCEYLLENITIKDLLPNNIKYINNSVYINDKCMPEYNIISGIPIKNLNINEEVNISFQVEALSMGDANNQSIATYEYSTSYNTQPLIGLEYSNVYNLNINSAILSVSKSSDKSNVSLNDIIEYNVKIKNNGNLNTFNVLFKDELPRYLNLIPMSFKVNNTIINSVDINSGVNIGNIPVGKDINISYKVKVISNPCNYQITNKAIVTYLYKLPDGTAGMGSSSPEEGMSIINMRAANFKQFGICEYLSIPKEKPGIEDINNISGEIEIIRSHIITTPKIESLEGQILSGYKVIIHGILKLIIEYTACEILQSVHSAHFAIPFSTFVVLPIDYVAGSKVSIHPIVEDIYSKCVDYKTLFIDASSMINVKILFC